MSLVLKETEICINKATQWGTDLWVIEMRSRADVPVSTICLNSELV